MRTRLLSGLVPAALVALAIAATALGGPSQRERSGGSASAALKDAEGRAVGTVRLLPRSGGKVEVSARLKRLQPGFHGFHVHETGVCDASARDSAGNPTPFSTAGGHLSSSGQAHGAHTGDLVPLYVMENGTARLRFVTDRFRVGRLLDEDGSAIVVHVDADNLANVPARYHSHTPDASSTTFGPDAATQSSGDAGARAACGVVRKQRRG